MYYYCIFVNIPQVVPAERFIYDGGIVSFVNKGGG